MTNTRSNHSQQYTEASTKQSLYAAHNARCANTNVLNNFFFISRSQRMRCVWVCALFEMVLRIRKELTEKACGEAIICSE